MNNVGINIRKLREKKGFSQEYVAQELGINQSTYGKLERENTKISIDRLLRISEILEEDVINLLDSNLLKKRDDHLNLLIRHKKDG